MRTYNCTGVEETSHDEGEFVKIGDYLELERKFFALEEDEEQNKRLLNQLFKYLQRIFDAN
jgi:hypothetical protein